MGTTTKLTFEEFVQLPEEPGKRFQEEKLFEGNLFTLPLASVFDEDLTK